MSDDEDYFEDEWEPVYDDGFGAQADDLAEHSMPSPTYLDYDSEGVDINESDMEGEVLEYLDFYYDDDPTLMNDRNAVEIFPSSRRKRKAADEHSHTNKKRKTDPSQGRNDSAKEDSTSKGRGIIWKVEDRDELPVHEPGKDEKVALLKDWRNLFAMPPKKEDNRTMKPTLVSRGRDSKKRRLEESNDSDDAPAPGKPTKAPQLAHGPRSRRSRSSPKPSPLKHSLSSTDLPTMNGPRKKPKPPTQKESNEDIVTPVVSTTKKRSNQDNEENEPLNSKRRAVSEKAKDDTASRNVLSTRKTRSRNVGGS